MTPTLNIVLEVCGVGSESFMIHKRTGIRQCRRTSLSQLLSAAEGGAARLVSYVGHTIKAGRKTDSHLAQFIPPFVYSSVVNAVLFVCLIFVVVFIHQLLAF